MSDLERVAAEIDAELRHVAASDDPTGADEPERTPYETRLRGLRDAVIAVETGHREPTP